MRVAHFDCFSGISGDMVLGAVIDAGVPVEQIRFRYLEGEYRPFQQTGGTVPSAQPNRWSGLVELNPATYHYYALQTIEHSPYAKPPATAAGQL